MAIEIETKKWGNSIGVIIPSETIANLNIKPGEKIVVEISKKENVLRELFGSMKFKESADKVLKKMRRDMEGEWLK